MHSLRQAGIVAACSLLMMCWVAQPAFAQSPADSAAERLADLTGRAKGAIRSGSVDVRTLESLRSDLAEQRDQLAASLARGDINVQSLQAERAELPAAPDKDSREPERLASERARLDDALAEADAPHLADRQALARLKLLITELDHQIRSRQRAETMVRGVSPLWPGTWRKGVRGMLQEADRIASEMRQDAALPTRRAALETGKILVAILLPIAIGGWFLADRLLLSRLEARETAVTGRRRLIRLVASVLARAVVHLLLSSLAVFALAAPFLRPGRTPEVMGELLVSPLVLTAASWLAHMLFAPHAPHRRLIVMPDAAARRAANAAQGLGLVVLLELFAEAAPLMSRIGEEGAALIALVILSLAVFCVWVLTHALRQRMPGDTVSDLRKGLIGLLQVVAVGAVAAVALGYAALGRAIIDPLLISLWIYGMTVVAQKALLLVVSGLWRMAGPHGGDPATTPETAHNETASSKLVSIAIGAGLLASVPLYALAWGARTADLRDGFLLLRDGIDLGGVRLSFGTITTLVLAFGLGVALTQFAQRLVRNEVLPNTRIDTGAQSAIATGFGYVGILLSALVAIFLAGIDLSSLAIVAGALSVGIGFGLQAVVSNFVCGLILLVERPVKEGDLIQVAGQSGTVRKISVRSTRLETAEGHDVIVPNADLITGLVRNMTLTSLSGRIDLPVGVAYGSDLASARRILLEIAGRHPMVLPHPAPDVLLIRPAESSVDLELRCFVRYIVQGIGVKSELYVSILAELEKAGIAIPYPTREVRITGATTATASAVTPSTL